LYLCNPTNPILKKENYKEAKFKQDEKISVNLIFKSTNVKVNFTPPITHKKNEKHDGKEKDLNKN
jgi:hypothetical protein